MPQPVSARMDALRRHMDNPAMSHLRPFLTDLLSTFEDHDNRVLSLAGAAVELYRDDIMNQVHHALTEGMQHMSALTDALTKAVAELSAKIAEHDAQVQLDLEALKSAMGSGDAVAIQAAIDAISGASAKLASETDALKTAMDTKPAA